MKNKKDIKWKFLKLNGKLNRNYKVSNYGHIINAKTKVPLKQRDMQKKSGKNGSDYKSVSIPGVSSSVRVHRIVCETFHGPAGPGQTQVNHIDEHKDNNVPSNLEWVTPSQNIQAYYQNNERSYFSRNDIVRVKRLLNKGMTNDQVGQAVGMSNSNVSSIKLGYIHSRVKPFTRDQKELGNC